MYEGFTAYYVEIIPQPKSGQPGSYDEEFTPPDNKTGSSKPANQLIRKIDGRSFYALVTGIPDALDQLYGVVSAVIEKISGHAFPAPEIPQLRRYFELAY